MQDRNFKFQEMALELFRWLEDYGYCLAGENSTIVRYEGPLGHVNVYHGRSSHEIGVEVGPPGEQISSYSMSELIRLKDGEEAKYYIDPTVTSPQFIKSFISAQAQRLQVYGKRIFTGDNKVWHDLKQQRQKWSEEYAMDILLSQVRPEAEKSFRNNDFKRVVELLSRVEQRLTPAERKKLEYARRKQRTTGSPIKELVK